MDYIICHYSEIGLKGKNRKFFEEKLVENIKRVLKPASFEFVKRISGRIIVKLSKKGIGGEEGEKGMKRNLKKVFGIAYFAFATSVPQKIKNIQENALKILEDPEYHKSFGFGYGASKKFKTFRIFTQRSKKEFHLTSQQVNENVGWYILKKLKMKNPGTTNSPNLSTGQALKTSNRDDLQYSPRTIRVKRGLVRGEKLKIRVDLEDPDVTCFIEVVEKYAFLYLEKIKGQGGLPVSVSGKAVVLLSGGIDSPVAAFFAIKRGVRVIFLHFHAYPFVSRASIEKAEKIVKILRDFQGESRIYVIPFADIQKEILMKTPAKLRMILYRRFMLRIAEDIAKKENALGVFTGESIGQVASQTLENIKVIEEAARLPVFRPLISQDKEEIIKKAREIGTFNVSILPHQDCCTRFLPSHPATRAKLEDIKKAEKKLNTARLIKTAVKNSSVKII